MEVLKSTPSSTARNANLPHRLIAPRSSLFLVAVVVCQIEPGKMNGVEQTSSKTFRVAVGSSNPAKISAVEEALRRKGFHSNDETNAATATVGTSAAIHGVEYDMQGFSVESGVHDQPFGDKDTRKGAKNRAKAAYSAYWKLHGRPPHFAVGMEGGLEWIADNDDDEDDDDNNDNNNDNNGNYIDKGENKTLYCMAWMAIYGRRQALTVDLFASEDAQSYFGDKKPIFGLAKTASFPLPPAITKLIKEEGLELGDADDQFFDRVNSKHGSGTVGILTNGRVDRAAYYEHALLLALTPWIRPDIYPHGSMST